jgi:hypothetical protein
MILLLTSQPSHLQDNPGAELVQEEHDELPMRATDLLAAAQCRWACARPRIPALSGLNPGRAIGSALSS